MSSALLRVVRAVVVELAPQFGPDRVVLLLDRLEAEQQRAWKLTFSEKVVPCFANREKVTAGEVGDLAHGHFRDGKRWRFLDCRTLSPSGTPGSLLPRSMIFWTPREVLYMSQQSDPVGFPPPSQEWKPGIYHWPKSRPPGPPAGRKPPDYYFRHTPREEGYELLHP